eukprot:g17681.t1
MAGRWRGATLPKTPVVMDNDHFSDSASSLDGGSDESSRLYAAAAAAPGAAAGSSAPPAANRGGGGAGGGDAGRRRRSGGIPSLISRHGSRSNLGVENGISRAHEISSQAAAAAAQAAEIGGYNVATLPPTARPGPGTGGGGGSDHHRRLSSSAYTIGTSSSLDISGASATDRSIPRDPGSAGGVGWVDSAAGIAAPAAAGAEEGGGGGVGGGESASSEGDMTWEDFLASTDELGESARTAGMAVAAPNGAAAAAAAGDTGVMPRRPIQQQQQQQQRPPPFRHLSSGVVMLASRGGTAAAAGASAAEAPLQPNNASALAAARGKEAGMSFGSGLTSWGTSKADEEESDRDSAGSGAGANGDVEEAMLKQELTWGQFIIQRQEEPAVPSKKSRGGAEPDGKPAGGFDAFDDDDDDDIDDIMSTFGPVSIRTGQEDILFCPQEEEPLPMFDRVIGKAPDASVRQGGGSGAGAGVVRIGSGRGGAGAQGAREDRSGGRSGAGSGLGAGGRIPGGIRGNGVRAAPPVGPAAEAATAAATTYKKPSLPPPAYSSLPRPRESPPAVPPPLGGGGGGRGWGGGGRTTAPAQSHVPPTRLGRRGEDSFGASEDPGSRRTPPGASGVQTRNRTSRPRSHPAAGAPDLGRLVEAERTEIRQNQRASLGHASQIRLGIPLSKFRGGQNARRKERQHGHGAPPPGNQTSAGAGARAVGGSVSPPVDAMAPLSPPPYSGGEAGKAAAKYYPGESSGRTGAAGAAGGGVGGPSAAPGGEGAGGAAGPAEREASPRLTASLLQALQPSTPSPAIPAFDARELPEGLPSAKQGGAYWGKRTRNRDTLHSLIEGHPSLGTLGEPPPNTGDPARERSHTDESQARPAPAAARARTGSGGGATAAEIVRDGGGGGSGEVSLGLASTTAAALRSAMTLLRNDSTVSKDTAPATNSSLGSRVFRTFSSVSSGGAKADVKKEAQAEKGAAAAGGGAQQKGTLVHATVPPAEKRATAMDVIDRRGSVDVLHAQAKRLTVGRSERNQQATPAAQAAGTNVIARSAPPQQQESLSRAVPPPPPSQQQQQPSARAVQAQQAAAARLKSLEEEQRVRAGGQHQHYQQQSQGDSAEDNNRTRQPRETETTTAAGNGARHKKYTRRLAHPKPRGQAKAQAERRAKAERMAKEAQERVREEERAFVEAYSASAAAAAEQQAVASRAAEAEAAKAAAQAHRDAKVRTAAESAKAVAEATARAHERQTQLAALAEAAEARRHAPSREAHAGEDRRRAAPGADPSRAAAAATAAVINAGQPGARSDLEARRARAEAEARKARERRDLQETAERERKEREREEKREREGRLENERRERERRELDTRRRQQLQQQLQQEKERLESEMHERREKERRAKEEQEKAEAARSTLSSTTPFSMSSSMSSEVGGARHSKSQSAGATQGATAVKRGSIPANSFFAVSPVESIPLSPAEVAAQASPPGAAVPAAADGRGDSASALSGGNAVPEQAAGLAKRDGAPRSLNHFSTPPAPNARYPVMNGAFTPNAPGAAPATGSGVAAAERDAAEMVVAQADKVDALADRVETLEVSIPPNHVVEAAEAKPDPREEEAATAVDAAPAPAPPLTQMERDENILRAHLASWRFCFHEAAALLTPVLGAACVETPHGGGIGGDSGFMVAPSEEVDLHSELWAKLVQAEALMLQTMLSVSSGANKDTLAACEAVSEALELSLPASRNRDALREEIAFKLAGAAEVAGSRSYDSPPASAEAIEAVSLPPTLAEQSLLMELEVLMVRVAMQLMAGHMLKAATLTRKFLKASHWLLKAKDVDTKAAKRARDKAKEANSGVGMLQSFFFNKKSTPVAAPPASAPPTTARSPAAAAANGHGHGYGNGSGNGNGIGQGDGRKSRFANGPGSGVDEETYRLIEEAVPTEFAGRSWEGYLHHVDFIVALMHVGTSLIPKSLMKLIGHVVGYTPSFDKGLSLLSGCCRMKGMRRPCAAAVLELLVFRELKREAKLMKTAKAPKPTSSRVPQNGSDNTAVSGKRGFRRRIQFRQAAAGDPGGRGGGGGGVGPEVMSRAVALDNAQVALESFYASFPVVPLLSVAHAKALQTSGEYEEAYDLCLMAQKVVDESVEKGDGMGPAHDPHVLWLQLAFSSFFLQRWSSALEGFTRIVEGVTQVCENDKRGLTGFSAAYAAASMCGVQPVNQTEVHKLLVVAFEAMKKQEAIGAKEYPGLRGRLQGYTQRGPPGAELWLFELLYLHNASAANSMPEAWHESMLELLGETPVAAASRAFPQPGHLYSPSETDAIMAHKFTEGLVLYKLERMEESLDFFRLIADCARDKDEPPAPREEGLPPQVLLTESRFVLPHALYLTAHLSYRLRPVEEQLYLSHDLCVRAKRIKEYDFDCQVKIGTLMASLRKYMDTTEAAAK